MKVILLAVLAATLLAGTISAQRPRGRRASQPPPAKKSPLPAAKSATAPSGVVNLSAADVGILVLELGLSPDARARLASSAEERRTFAKHLRDMFALAEKGRATGLLALPEVKLQLEQTRAFVIARIYTRKRESEGATPNEIVSEAEASALLSQPGQSARFEELHSSSCDKHRMSPKRPLKSARIL